MKREKHIDVKAVYIHTSNLRKMFEQRERDTEKKIWQTKNSKNFLDDDERSEKAPKKRFGRLKFRRNFWMTMSEAKGITLVALVVTIVILLILAGITLATLTGENGLFTRAKEAKEKTQREAATEKINLVIADAYVKSYAEKQENPTLQDLADGFCEDEETEYVDVGTRKTSSLDKIEVGTNEAIYVKLKKYPYEFKIDSNIKIATIDGVDVSEETGGTGSSGTGGSSGSDSNPSGSGSIDSEEYKQMQETIAQMQEKISALEKTKADIEGLAEANDRIKSNKDQIDNMLTTLDVDTRTTLFEGTAGTKGQTYPISDISEYKYIIIYSSFRNRAGTVTLKGSTHIENVSNIIFSSKNIYYIDHFSGGTDYVNMQFYFPSPTELTINSINQNGWNNSMIYRIEGIK